VAVVAAAFRPTLPGTFTPVAEEIIVLRILTCPVLGMLVSTGPGTLSGLLGLLIPAVLVVLPVEGVQLRGTNCGADGVPHRRPHAACDESRGERAVPLLRVLLLLVLRLLRGVPVQTHPDPADRCADVLAVHRRGLHALL